MSHSRDVMEEIKDAKRDNEFLLRCRISDNQYQILECIRRRNVEQLKHLMACGVDPGFCDDTGNTPLHVVTSTPFRGCKALKEILEILVFFGTSLEAGNRFGQTPLHLACSNSSEVVKVLLEAAAKVNVQDNAGRTPLMEVCSSQSPEALTIMQYLLDNDCNVFLADEDGYTALHCVCENNKQDPTIRNEIVFKLLYAGLSATTEDKTGKMALCHELGKFLNLQIKKPVSDRELLVTRTLMQAGAGFNRRKKSHEQMIKFACTVSEGPLFTQIASVFQQTLSLSSIKAIQDCIPKQDKGHREFFNYLSGLSRTVHSLKYLCRVVVREELKGKLFTKVQLLAIPNTLKDYLIIK